MAKHIKLPKRLRTPADFSKFLLGELGWRRKETRYLRSLVDKGGGAVDTLTRAAVAMLYAHWEGFLKVGASAYIEHVRLQGRKLSELQANFVALSARKLAEGAIQSARWEFQIAFCRAVRERDSVQAKWPKSWNVDTGSNLTVELLRDIILLLGIPYRVEFQLAEKPIIERLLELRNDIAHGKEQGVDPSEFHQLDDKIDELLQVFCNELDNAAAAATYRV